MRRVIVYFLIITACFLLQSTVFQSLAIAGISPNLLVVVPCAYGMMRGKKEGLIVGFFCGLIMDIFFGFYLGVYALIYMYIGYINGFVQKHFYPDDLKLPLAMIAASDIIQNLIIYVFMFLLRGRFEFLYYFKAIIVPEFVYTMVVTIFLYLILLKINQGLESYEKRRAKKFDA